jgi:hypothetical protein
MSDTQIETSIETGAEPVFDLPRHASVYITGGVMKAIEYGRVGGYLVVFTSPTDRDSYDEYFTGATDYGLSYYRNQPVLYHHGQKDELVTPIGIIDTLRMEPYGIYAEAQLDVNHEDPTIRQYARTAYAQVNAGKLFWSSGSADHLVRVSEDGEIKQWFIVEGSLTPTPAEQRGRTQVEVLRAAVKAFNDEHSAIEATPPKEPEKQKTPNFKRKGQTRMDSQMILAALDNVSTLDSDAKLEIMRALGAIEAGEGAVESPTMAEAEPEPPAEPPAAPPQEPIAAAPRSQPTGQEIARSILDQMRTAPAKGLPAGGGQNPAKAPLNQITMRTKYHDLSPVDMSYMHDWRAGMARHGKTSAPDAKFTRELLDKTQKALAYDSTRSQLNLNHQEANRILAIKDNELDNTAFATGILEWIPTLWTSELWRRVRLDNEVASQFRVIEMPSNVYELPIESTDPTVYLVPETTNESQLLLDGSGNPTPDSRVSSGKVTLTAKKLGLRVGFSSEAEEDSIVPFIPQLREQGIRALANAVDNVLLNGDTVTTASTNINDIAGTPAATDKFLIFNGILKNALVTTAGMSLDMGNSKPTLASIRLLRSKMQSALNVYGLRPDDLVMFVDPYTWFTMLSIDEINSWLNNGRNATVNNGMLPNIDGIPVFPSQEMGLANAAGKIDQDTVANNAYGRIAMAAKMGWTIGYRRQVQTNVDYLSYYDSYQFTANLRLAFINKDGYASSAAFEINVN